MPSDITGVPTWSTLVPVADDGEDVNQANRIISLQPMINRSEKLKDILANQSMASAFVQNDETNQAITGAGDTLNIAAVVAALTGDFIFIETRTNIENTSGVIGRLTYQIQEGGSGIFSSVTMDVAQNAFIQSGDIARFTVPSDGNYTFTVLATNTSGATLQAVQHRVMVTRMRPIGSIS